MRYLIPSRTFVSPVHSLYLYAKFNTIKQNNNQEKKGYEFCHFHHWLYVEAAIMCGFYSGSQNSDVQATKFLNVCFFFSVIRF